MTRRVSQAGIEEIKEMESVEPYVYTCAAHHQTIGVGHKITAHELESGLLMIDGRAVVWINGLTPDQIDGLLRADLAEAERVVEECVKAPLTDNQHAALCSLAFNIGSTAFRSSSVVRALNRGDHALVPGLMRLWNKITVREIQEDGSVMLVKRVSKGLVNRRESEIRLWSTP